MYELIILSLLMRSPYHGYRIAKITNDIIGPSAKVSNGTLYPLLAKLETRAQIATMSDACDLATGDRQVRRFTITDAGRQRFHDLMMDTTSNPGEYRKFFRLKAPYLDLVPPAARLHLIDHYLHYCRSQLRYDEGAAEALAHTLPTEEGVTPFFIAMTIEVIRHSASEWEAEVAWAALLRERIAAFGEAGSDGVATASAAIWEPPTEAAG